MARGPNSDIQAVILCGPGHGLDPLIDEDTAPKCLLPVANKPLLYYPVTWLQQSGVSGTRDSYLRHFIFLIDIILVAHHSLHSRLTQFIKLQISEGGSHIEILSLEGMGNGTIDALRAARPKLHSDFILLSCDLITEFPLYKLIDQHRTNDALVTMLLAASQSSMKGEENARYGNLEDNEVFAGTDESRKKLLYLVGKADVEDTLDFKMSLLNKHHCILLKSNLIDTHCYIFRREFLEILDNGSVFGKHYNMFSVREELLPRLVRKQKLAFNCPSKESVVAKSLTNVALRIVDGEFCVRVNNLKSFTEANRHYCRNIPQGVARISPSAEVNPKGQVGNDSIVSDYSKVGEKSSVKRSIIGTNVIIGKNVKISNSIIMDKVVIEDKYINLYISLLSL